MGAALLGGCADTATDLVPDRHQAAAVRGQPRQVQAPFRGDPGRSGPRRTEGVGAVTTTAAQAQDRFAENRTQSDMCGFTLMNNQVGSVVATVMKTLPNVTVTYLPSMIRIDGKHRFDVVYADIDEAAGEEPGWFNAAEFEES